MGTDLSGDFGFYFCYHDRVIYNLPGPDPDSPVYRAPEAMETAHDDNRPSSPVGPLLLLKNDCEGL
jgi:hypothetical protein